MSSPRGGVDVGDHPPITPVALATHLTGDEERIYGLVVRHFLATVSKDAIYLSTKASFLSSSGEMFSVSGKREIDLGFLEVYGTREASLDLPADLAKRSTYRVASVKIKQGATSAPGHLTESELIGLMEKHGIGTDASIPTHINNILVRNYVTLGSNRTLIPTELGVVLVHGYQRIDPDLVFPDVRAAIESFCDLIAKGKASKEAVVAHSIKNFQKKFIHFTSNINAMDALFEATFSPLAASGNDVVILWLLLSISHFNVKFNHINFLTIGKSMCKCGKCARYMRFIPLKPQRLYCPTCEETYSLPSNGTIKLYKELKCPLDQFELVLFSLVF